MASRFVIVTDEKELRKYYDAGMLYYKYNDVLRGTHCQEFASPWDGFRREWVLRGDSWDSYVLIEEDTE